jgi:hypothetical protein
MNLKKMIRPCLLQAAALRVSDIVLRMASADQRFLRVQHAIDCNSPPLSAPAFYKFF